MKPFFLFLLCLLPHFMLAQTEDTLSNCESLALRNQELIPNILDDAPIENIRSLLAIWEEVCGENEPIARARLLLDIAQNTFQDSSYQHYFTAYPTQFSDRVFYAQENNYETSFKTYKAYFSYVPLRSSFDAWTKNIALNLLPKQAKNSKSHLLCLIFAEEITEYEQLIIASLSENKEPISSTNSPTDSDFRPTFTISTAIWSPIGNAAKMFSPSPEIALRVGAAWDKFRIDGGALIRILGDNKPYQFQTWNGVLPTESTIGFAFIVSGGYQLAAKKGYSIETAVGLGASFLPTDLDKFPNDPDTTAYFNVTTFESSIGLNFNKKIKKTTVGLNLSGHYIPYNLDYRVKTNLGSLFWSAGVFIRL